MPFAAALEHAGEAAGLALEVEAQRQAVHVLEGLQRELAHRMHRDLGEQAVADLGQQRHERRGRGRRATSAGCGARQSQEPAVAAASAPCPPPPVTATSASVAHLNVKGVTIVTSLATSSRPKARKTRRCRSGRPCGHR